MTVYNHKSAKAMLNEIFQKSVQEVDISSWRGRQSSWEFQMMVGVAQPLQRGEQDAVGQGFSGPPNDFAQEQTIGENGQMPPMLFESRHRKYHRCIFAERGNRRPVQISQLHGGLSGEGI